LERLAGYAATAIGKISIPGAPDWKAIAPDAVWVSNGDMNNVARVDPNTNAIVATGAVGQSPCYGLAAGFGSVGAELRRPARRSNRSSDEPRHRRHRCHSRRQRRRHRRQRGHRRFV